MPRDNETCRHVCPKCGCSCADIRKQLDVIDDMKTEGVLTSHEWHKQRQKVINGDRRC